MMLDVYEETRTALIALAKTRPDYVYANPQGKRDECLYFHGDQPGCIAGTLLHGLANEAVDEAMRNADERLLNTGDGSSVESVLAGVFEFTGNESFGKAVRLLGKAQGYQDAGEPWLRATRLAIHVSEGHVIDLDNVADCPECSVIIDAVEVAS